MRGTLDVDVAPCVPPPTVAQRKKGFSARWSLRRLLYSSPILGRRRTPPNPSSTSTRATSNWGRDYTDTSSRSVTATSSTIVKTDLEKGTGSSGISHHAEIHKATSRSSVFTASTKVSVCKKNCTVKVYHSTFYTIASLVSKMKVSIVKFIC